MKLAVMQPYFFPYLGYFQLIGAVDYFVLLDDVQYIRHGWINRNRILKPDKGVQYIIAPLKKHTQKATIREINVVDGPEWKNKIVRQLEHYKRKAPFYADVKAFLEECFSTEEQCIAKLNANYLKRVLKCFNIQTPIVLSSELELDYSDVENSDEWALKTCEQIGATEYINPLGGSFLFDRQKYIQKNIKLTFLEPTLTAYNQGQIRFEPGLSIIDVMLFNSAEEIIKMLAVYKLS